MHHYNTGVVFKWLRSTEGSSDGFTWRCSDCKTMKFIRHNSFFTKSRPTLQKWLLMLQMWSRKRPVRDAASEAEISERTAIDIYQWFREVCSTKLHGSTQILLNLMVQELSRYSICMELCFTVFS